MITKTLKFTILSIFVLAISNISYSQTTTNNLCYNIDEFDDKDYKMFDDELLEAVFTEDVNSEKPNLAIIDTSIVNPPHYFLEYIKKNFKILKIDGDLEIYELNN